MVKQKTIPTEGQIFISVNGNRLKQHANNTVYLENGKEFSLEIFNPTQSKILAKIKINGNYISSSGIALNPGKRVFLERYLDVAKKFKFDTYSVDNSPEVADAIANNGLVEVEFYNEYIAPVYTTYTYTSPQNWNTFPGSLTNGDSINTLYNSSCENLKGQETSYKKSLVKKTTSSGLKPSLDSMSFCDASASMDMLSGMDLKRSFCDVPKETGRVEQGSHSNQSFKIDYATYNSFCSNKVTWKILPLSQKPVEVSDLKTFCPICKTKIKKTSWKYCPHCGSKFE